MHVGILVASFLGSFLFLGGVLACLLACLLTLACDLDSVCACGDAHGLAVVEVLQHLDAEAWVGAVSEVGHFGGTVRSF
jgi:hypothetical protein